MTEILPDIPGIVHGVKSVDPYVLQCDGCLAVFVQGDAPLVTFLQDVTFHYSQPGNRMCAVCWGAEGVTRDTGGRVT